MSTLWRPLREQGALSTRIAAEIERVIEERHLQPGDRLPPERDMAQLFGVSRPSVREAVRTLEARGRLRVRHGLGVWISAPQPMHGLGDQAVGLQELFAMREVLEVPAAGWAAARARPEDVASLRVLVGELERLGQGARDQLDWDALRRADISFHLAIATLAGNRFMRQVMGVLHDMLAEGMETTLSVPGRLARSRTEHRRIVDAVAIGDKAGSRAAMRRHIRNAQAAGLRRLGEHGFAAG
jgi:GntR family transcriptional repressor for pyruvate dehydrogenase complex